MAHARQRPAQRHFSSCNDEYTEEVRMALANDMFAHCGAWCLFDVNDPTNVAYSWNGQDCWNRDLDGGCLENPEQEEAIVRQNQFCTGTFKRRYYSTD